MKLIMINGPMGVGKSTVGKYIADHHTGTAFIDGDWCLDLHPFVGNRETKQMAVDNILHMCGNYRKCSECSMIVLVWLMDEEWVRRAIREGAAAQDLEVVSVTLLCDEERLKERWSGDERCEWRTDEWLEVSLRSLEGFSSMGNTIDTGGLTVEEVAEEILRRGNV